MPLYRLGQGKAVQVKPSSFSKERDLQRLFEANLEELMGVRFIGSEFATGDRQRGRIDTLGLDQDGSPTIIEYKKTGKDNVINQGLFYLDWLVDHKGDFTLAAQRLLGQNVQVDWGRPRLILIAENFSDYDKYAVNRIGANIELWAYRRYGDEFLHLDPVYIGAPAAAKTTRTQKAVQAEPEKTEEAPVYTVQDHLEGKQRSTLELFERMRERILAVGDEEVIVEKATKNYIAYKHGKNFCEIWVQANKLRVWLDIAPADLTDPLKLGRDVTKVGHWGTGDVELTVDNLGQVDAVIYLVAQAYQQTL